MRIGLWKDKVVLEEDSRGFIYSAPDTCVTYLGVGVSPSQRRDLIDFQFAMTQSSLQDILSKCRYQSYSTIGRILLLKSLIASRLVYKFLYLPSPSPKVLNSIHQNYSDFAWGGGRHRMSQKNVQQPVLKGGLNMLNVFFQNRSLKYKWLHVLLQDHVIKPFWIQYLEGVLLIRVKDFLRCNIHYSRVPCLFRDYDSVPLFWKLLFKDWFIQQYVSRPSFVKSPNDDRGLYFNSALSFHLDFERYWWLNSLGAFTIMEVQEIWCFLSSQDKCYLLSYFLQSYQSTVCHIIEKKPDLDDRLFVLLANPRSSVKLTYSFLIQASYEAPQNVICKWERDLGESVQDMWTVLCLKAGLIFETNLRAFHIQFLHRAYLLNNTRAKFSNVDPMCTFCGSELETYIHVFLGLPTYS